MRDRPPHVPCIPRSDSDDPARARFVEQCLRRLAAVKANQAFMRRLSAEGVNAHEYFTRLAQARWHGRR